MMEAVPLFTPVMVGVTNGAVAPCGMKMLFTLTVTFEVSLLFSARETPPAIAGAPKVTGYGTV
jgi:hypothetical protein